MKKIISVFSLALALTGCSSIYEINNDANDSINQLMGTYSAPLLGSSPRPSGCASEKCRQLDELEKFGYAKVHEKTMTWKKFVDFFYEGRSQFFPKTNDDAYTRELISFQRVLAVQMDERKITETQWAYLIDKKFAEMQSRIEGQKTTCNTQNTGSNAFPNYRTICR